MPRTSRLPLLFLPILALASCQEAEVSPLVAIAPPAPNRFAPESARPGESIAGLEIVSAELAQSEVNSAYVGWVQFSGEVELEGVPRVIESNEPEFLCMDVSDETADRLPRMRHDDRRVWFCFTNQEEAKAAIGNRIGQRVRVRISDYRTVYEFTDAYDTAELEEATPAVSN
jgi:hypothetical protein